MTTHVHHFHLLCWLADWIPFLFSHIHSLLIAWAKMAQGDRLAKAWTSQHARSAALLTSIAVSHSAFNILWHFWDPCLGISMTATAKLPQSSRTATAFSMKTMSGKCLANAASKAIFRQEKTRNETNVERMSLDVTASISCHKPTLKLSWMCLWMCLWKAISY